MRLKIIFLLCISLSIHHTYTQTIQGVVCDEKTKYPVPEAFVFLDGTSINTITDKNGRFELNAKTKILNTKLVITHLSYKDKWISKPFEITSDTLFLEEKLNPIQEVIIQKDDFKRRKKLEAFRMQFLGISEGGRSCVILNENDIEITYHPYTMTLSAYCDQPIIIRNIFLGYEITFDLAEFKIIYHSENTLNPSHIKQVSIFGSRFFKDIKPDNQVLRTRRKAYHRASPQYFFLNLSRLTLSSYYRIYTQSKYLNNATPVADLETRTPTVNLYPEKNMVPDRPVQQQLISRDTYFMITDTLSLKSVFIPDFDLYKVALEANQPASANIINVYDETKNQWSRIIFLTDSFMIDSYGNTDMVDKILLSLNFSQYRVGNMLPLDYLPHRSSK